MATETLAAVTKTIEAGFDEHGLVHRLLATWSRLDPNGAPGGGQLVRGPALRLDDLDDAALLAIGGLGQMAIPLAQAEARAYLAQPGTETAAAPGDALSRAVRAAIARCLGRSTDLAIWINTADEELATRSGALPAIHPEPLLDALWHRVRVIYQSFVPPGAVWVAGVNAGTLVHHADADGRRIQVGVQLVDGVRMLDVRMRLDVVRCDPASLQRISIERTPSAAT